MVMRSFDWHSQRSMHSRYGATLGQLKSLLFAASTLLIILAGVMLYFNMVLAWLVLIVAVPMAMIYEWYKFGLKDMPRLAEGAKIDDVLDSDILALLPEQPSPQEVVSAVYSTAGGHFFAVRFGVTGNMLINIVSGYREDTEQVFAEAMRLASKFNGRVSAGVLIVALLRQVPRRLLKTIMGQIELTEDDLIRGIYWHHYLQNYVKDEEQRELNEGGIGRDWSFGWIPNLTKFGSNISLNGARSRPDIRPSLIGKLLESVGEGKPPVALVGALGVGKTEVVNELADKLMHPDESVPKGLRYKQIFAFSATRLISTGTKEVGPLIEVLFSEAFRAKNIIVFLDDAELFMDDSIGSVDLLSTLLPIFRAQRMPILLSLDEQKYLQVIKRSPEFSTVVARVNVDPTDELETMKIMTDHVPVFEYKNKVVYMYQAMKEAYKLGKRYVYDVSMPGQAISLMRTAAEYAEDGLVTSRSVARAVENTIGVKTVKTSDDAERELLLNLEKKLHDRMVGQDRAVGVVSDALRRARAGVHNQDRPLGTFLFLGPTGVGKTELSKSLAEVYFGGEDNLIRLDMNEFVSSDDVARLIADGADNPMSLTAQVMKKPFSVILLDEIEKADSSVLTTLLQLLDEGILRDEKNREVSFRDTIVIATSNAGADRIQEYLFRGYSLQQFEGEFINELIGGHVFHPEFLNRFDEIVVFGSLSKQELLLVVDRIMNGINKNLSVQNITVKITPEAKGYLVEKGYDPRLGARPMRRMVQKAVENTVAKMLLSGSVNPGDVIKLDLSDVTSVIDNI